MTNTILTLQDMIFDASFHRSNKNKPMWTVYTQILDVHVYVTVFNEEVQPVIELACGKEVVRTNSIFRATKALQNAVQTFIQ